MKKFLCLILIIILVMQNIFVYAEAGPVDRLTKLLDWSEFTPQINVFKIEGSNKEFILLDTTKDDNSKYFVLSKDDYGRMYYDKDKTQKFDINDSNNIAYWLNNDFKNNGNGEGEKLPDQIIKYIDFSHIWSTEAGNSRGNCPVDYDTQTGIALLSQQEFFKYYSKIGLRDNMLASGFGWWFRTAHGLGATPDLMLSCKVSDDLIGKTDQWPAQSQLYVRPAFYLNKDFFKQNKLNISSLGSNVKKAILKNYSIEDMKSVGYTDEEIEMIKDTTADVSEKFNVSTLSTLGDIMDPSNVGFNIDIETSGSKSKNYKIDYLIKGSSLEKQSIEVQIEPKNKQTKTLKIQNINNGIFELEITITSGNRFCNSLIKTFSVMPTYQRQFMDDYTHKGIVTHFGLTNQTNEKDAVLINRAGIRYIRDDFYWSQVEKIKGNYDFNKFEGYVLPRDKDGMYIIGAVSGGNKIYSTSPTFSSNDGLTTKEQIDAYCNYLISLVKHFPQIKEIEIWNEPNGGIFWKPTSVSDYTNLLKAASVAIKSANPNVKVIGGVVSGTDTKFVNDMFERGAFHYVDSISFHPYIYPSSVDQGYKIYLEKMRNTINKYGAWKDMIISEVGWSSNTGSKGVSEEKQATEMVKQFVLSDSVRINGNAIYTFREKGADQANIEDMFGILHRNYSAKPAYLALTQMNIKLGGAVYYGEVELSDNINAHLYQKNNKPLMVLWAKDSNDAYTFENEKIYAEDMIGNKINTNTINLTQSPVYIEGLSAKWFNKVIASSVNKIGNDLLKQWNETLEDDKFTQNIQDILNYSEVLSTQVTLPKEDELTQKIQRIYEQGKSLINKLEEKQMAVNELEVSQLLFQINYIGENFAKLLAVSVNSANVPSYLLSKDRLEKVELAMNNSLKDRSGSALIYSEAMLQYAKNIVNNTEKVKGYSFNSKSDVNFINNWDLISPLEKGISSINNNLNTAAKAGVLRSWDMVSYELLSWVEQFMKVEKAQNTSLLLQVAEKDTSVFAGVEKDVNVLIRNSSNNCFNGKLVLSDTNGNVISELNDVKILENQNISIPLPIKIQSASKTGKLDCTLKFIQKDVEIVSYNAQFKTLDKVGMELIPCNTTLDNINDIKLKVTNNFNQKMSGSVTINPPEGWVIDGVTQSVTLDELESKELNFKISKTDRVPYNIYVFDIKIKDSLGNVIMNKNLPLGFTTVVQNKITIDPQKFDGDITNWSDAYPVYINPPAQSNVIDEWSSSDNSAMVFTKWDDKYLYLLGNIYDNAFAQNRNSSSIWDGDCIQFSIDVTNTKSKGYDKDDYEYGVARTGKGEEVYAWQVAESGKAGQQPGEWLKVIRDNTKHNTRYLFRIPRNNLSPMLFETGTNFGLNIAINDADMDNREKWNQLTKGTADGKNPINYYTWSLRESEPMQYDVDKYNIPIDVKISNDKILDFNTMHNDNDNK